MVKTLGERHRISSFKLHALLSITQAINENLSVEELLARYRNLLEEDLKIGKILIFKFDEKRWECLLFWGLDEEVSKTIVVERDLLKYNEITTLTSSGDELARHFDIVIPVYKTVNPIAYILIGDLEEGEGVSPVIKHLSFVQTLSNIIMVAIENIRMFNELLRQEALKKELELASRMQSMLIPRNETLPKNNHIRITSFYHPHYEVGGDYYDCIRLSPEEIGFCIADVSGKGISAALLMSNFQANLRALFSHEISLTLLVEKLNERVMSNANGEKFITLFIAKYNYRTRELNFVNAGHNPPVLYHIKSRRLVFLRSGCVGIGMLDEIPFIQHGSMFIKEPSKMICYTDGLVELIDDTGVGFGTAVIEENIANNRPVSENIDSIIHSRGILSGNKAIFDDITILGIEFYA